LDHADSLLARSKGGAGRPTVYPVNKNRIGDREPPHVREFSEFGLRLTGDGQSVKIIAGLCRSGERQWISNWKSE
jgi:hypothetical protein